MYFLHPEIRSVPVIELAYEMDLPRLVGIILGQDEGHLTNSFI
jgi:hypothetical protein